MYNSLFAQILGGPVKYFARQFCFRNGVPSYLDRKLVFRVHCCCKVLEELPVNRQIVLFVTHLSKTVVGQNMGNRTSRVALHKTYCSIVLTIWNNSSKLTFTLRANNTFVSSSGVSDQNIENIYQSIITSFTQQKLPAMPRPALYTQTIK